jgi:hypothetical protein
MSAHLRAIKATPPPTPRTIIDDVQDMLTEAAHWEQHYRTERERLARIYAALVAKKWPRGLEGGEP